MPILKPAECRVFSSPLPIQSSVFHSFHRLPLTASGGLPATGLAEDPHYRWRKGQLRRPADRLRFLIANPAGRKAAGKTAQKRIEQRHQWQKIARVE
ncbi:MAG TPA: hypothetical protein VNX60_00595 [Candidatus Acidoferrum sp.]|nr:hypothetical protein [Candidatus Acidoferrum sp.]